MEGKHIFKGAGLSMVLSSGADGTVRLNFEPLSKDGAGSAGKTKPAVKPVDKEKPAVKPADKAKKDAPAAKGRKKPEDKGVAEKSNASAIDWSSKFTEIIEKHLDNKIPLKKRLYIIQQAAMKKTSITKDEYKGLVNMFSKEIIDYLLVKGASGGFYKFSEDGRKVVEATMCEDEEDEEDEEEEE